jgi:hypothetical protein
VLVGGVVGVHPIVLGLQERHATHLHHTHITNISHLLSTPHPT